MKIGSQEIQFNSDQIFNVATKAFNKIAIKRKPCLIHVKGKSTCTKYKDLDEDLEGITNKDRKNFVRRALARALTNVKPISFNMFLVLAGLGVANIVLLILLVRG